MSEDDWLIGQKGCCKELKTDKLILLNQIYSLVVVFDSVERSLLLLWCKSLYFISFVTLMLFKLAVYRHATGLSY